MRLQRRDGMQKARSKKDGITVETFAPTTRHSSWRALTAAARVRRRRRELRTRVFDVEAAYLQGDYPPGMRVIARPPPGYRRFDRRGVAIVWVLAKPLYGEADAGRIWNATFRKQIMLKQGFKQSDFDPCYFYKVYEDGSRIDLCLYVDDGWVEDDAGELADADLAILAERFKMTLGPPKQFLGMRIISCSPTSISYNNEVFLTELADRLPQPLSSYPIYATPADGDLRRCYEVALERAVPPSLALVKRYQSKVCALMYNARVDYAAVVGLLARALTFPTEALELCVDRAIAYAAQTASLPITFSADAPDAAVMTAESDSDWAVGHSTSGFFLMLAGAAFAYSARRQQCITLASTEAEIVAASACATEIVFFRGMLREMGLPQLLPTRLGMDNSGAIQLSRDRRSCHRSRHVDRRFFKVRELMAEGYLITYYVPTDELSADLLTKALPARAHKRHTKRLLNLQ